MGMILYDMDYAARSTSSKPNRVRQQPDHLTRARKIWQSDRLRSVKRLASTYIAPA